MKRYFLFIALIIFPIIGFAQAPKSPAPVIYDTDILTPEFHAERRNFAREAMPENTVAVFFSAPERNRESDVSFEYRQDSDLYYLTGTHESGSALILLSTPFELDGQQVNEILFVPRRDASREVWTGRRFGIERAGAKLGFKNVYGVGQFGDVLDAVLSENKAYKVWHLPLPTGVAGGTLAGQLEAFKAIVKPLEMPADPSQAQIINAVINLGDADTFGRMQGWLKQQEAPIGLTDDMQGIWTNFLAAKTFEEWQSWKNEKLAGVPDGISLRGLLNVMRMTKLDPEIALMQKAIDITALAHQEVMRSLEPGQYEYEMEALLEYIFKRNGAAYTGFPSIVGSGENSVILHYESNRKQIEANDMVVFDIGAEYHGYSADVTRTLPADGKFSPEQKIIYELVLKAQTAGIKATRAGNGFREPDQVARKVITDGLMALGLISDPEQVRRFFMHGTSHYLGLYVHDAGTYGNLEAGHVITVEPGIYIAPADDIDPKWWNIGVRIEDDILVTDDNPVNMSAGAPRSVAEIEALMAETGLGNSAAGKLD